MENNIIPPKERKKIRDREIRALYKIGYTMDQIAKKVSVSKSVVFFAVNHSYKKKIRIEKRSNKIISQSKAKK